MINCLPNRIAESGLLLNRKEKSLYNAWLNQAFDPTNLRTVEGQSISILKPGERNETEGPDFRAAMILIDGRFEQGDIELHLDSADWYRHNHDQDPHYDNVILHVVLTSGKTVPVKTGQNRIIPTLKISPVETLLEIQACKKWGRISVPDFNHVIKQFAEIRFRRKAQTFRALIMANGLEQIFYEGLADVMGYSRNRLGFGKLAKKIPFQSIQSILKETPPDHRIIVLESLLFGTAGFLTKPELKKFIRDTNYSNGLRQIWLRLSRKYNLNELESSVWHFAGSRPPNFPSLRIAALAQILEKFYPSQPAASWLQILSNTGNFQTIKDWAGDKFQQPDGLWRNHPLLKQQPGKLLIGAQRLNDLMSNLLLPFGWAAGSINNDPIMPDRSIALAEQIECCEVPGTVKTALDRLALTSREMKSNYVIQGMIEFTRRYCDMNICILCPLEKYAEK